MSGDAPRLTVRDLRRCFEGAVPAVIATASAAGTPNVTYLSRVHHVDDERVALSNQFFSKTSCNLAENPRASLILVEPTTYQEYRLSLVYERTERRGPVFERLRDDVDALAAAEGMQDVFRLRAADIYRVLDIERMATVGHPPESTASTSAAEPEATALMSLATLTGRLSRSPDLDVLVSTALAGLDQLFGYRHSVVLLLDEDRRRLFTIGTHGYDREGIGSEVAVGDGLIGMAAARCAPVRQGSVRWMGRYSRQVRQAYEEAGAVGPGREIPLPVLPEAKSQLVVPAMAVGQLVGVLVVESEEPAAFDDADQAVLTVVAGQLAAAIEAERAGQAPEDVAAPSRAEGPPRAEAAQASSTESPVRVRFYPVDGSTFLDGDYLIKGVAGRLLWALLGHYEREGRTEFTNREVRLDPSLELPPFRDNFENRLILLKRRLDEREAPVRIHKTGRGRFHLVVDRPVTLETA